VRTPTRTLVTACALSTAFLVAGCGGDGDTAPASGGSGGEVILEPVSDRSGGEAILDPLTAHGYDPVTDSTAIPLRVTRMPQWSLIGIVGDISGGDDTWPDEDPFASEDPFVTEDPSAPADPFATEDPFASEDPSFPWDSTAEESEEIGPDTVPERPDPPDGGGLIPDDLDSLESGVE